MNFSFNVEIKDKKVFLNGMPYEAKSEKAGSMFYSLFEKWANETSFWRTNGLYNKGVYWPDYVEFAVQYQLSKKYEIQPTYHMSMRVEELNLAPDCYKDILNGDVVEAEMKNGEVEKVITRLQNPNNPDYDMCAAIMFTKNDCGTQIAKVKTIWVNAHNDNHRTIHVENYMTEEKEIDAINRYYKY